VQARWAAIAIMSSVCRPRIAGRCAAAAVVTAEGIAVRITLSSSTGSTGSPGQHITLNGSDRTAVATLVVPSFRSITVNLTIAGSGGHTATGNVTRLVRTRRRAEPTRG
jgi:hypothetical protein